MMNNDEKIVKGYVIRNVQYREKDAIITCLSEEGLICFKAAGILDIKSKNSACCLLYSYSEFVLGNKNDKYYLIKGKCINSNFKMYESIEIMCCLGMVSESIANFLGEANSTIYSFFSKLMEGINNGFDILTLSAINLAKIIIDSGYSLITSSCVRCGEKTNIVSLSYDDGGFVCRHCFTNGDVHENTEYLKSVRYTFMVDIDNCYHYTLDRNIAIRLIKEYCNYLLKEFGLRKVSFYELFNQLF